MVYFNYGVAEQEIIKECIHYLPNPNDIQGTNYKIHFVIKYPLSSLSTGKSERLGPIRICTALFRIEYEETGSKRWEFDCFDSDIKTEFAEPRFNN
jgi:hypothetical protein